mmetsp:Transcript_7436/g.12492  ORF Transcript_7436/g.12492 Transcript_7436/m.12492 type:complete len:160 (+) Transcript_7436:145-624(+)|eukprot:CAMPEP_0114422814 /NCGR_PEP_ID=MMETSP0103-20121206/5811_1 /TAXON_ID=37642 ORGANISM="Paraphysomonas imperforata, Strain PA2" /NCGR_SAMPLE_ID=MMETSP0103 /ASSEMBLY_ACC=CAM_ASM_000201 /LENGTH=159 /DNA_ID=CAMNT_0001591425 /DNA_START=140 /DNA_END=619 /DNA_ORIENTATION=-
MSKPPILSSADSLGSMSFASCDSFDDSNAISVSVTSGGKTDADSEISKDESVDLNQSMGLRNRHYNKDVKYAKKKTAGKIPIFTQTQISEMRRVINRKGMQYLKHYELQPTWVRLGMKGKYPKDQSILVNVAKMKQFAVVNLEIVAHTNDFANSWVSAS